MREIFKKILSKSFPTFLFLGSVLILYNFTNIFQRTESVNPTPVPSTSVLPSEIPDFQAYDSMQKRLVLVEDKETYSPKGKPIIGRTIRDLNIYGKFSRIYIYIEASVDNGKALTQWDSIFMALNGKGGHLLRSYSLKVPGDTITKLLYGLNQIPVISIPYSENKTPTILNWFDQLIPGSVVKFDTFLSTLRPGGKLNRVELRYECENGYECEIK